MRAMFGALAVLCGFLSGCFLHHASPGEKLSKSVQELNKSARWGQIGSASQLVDPSYRDQYLKTHQHWGSSLQVADTEIVHMEVAAGSESAIAMVAYSWYSTDAMTLHTSLVRQRWTSEGQVFALISETVVQGDPRLLQVSAAPSVPAMEAAPMHDPLSRSSTASGTTSGSRMFSAADM